MSGTLIVLSPLKVGGKLRPIGSHVDADLFSDEERARFLKRGILAEQPTETNSAPADDGKTGPSTQDTEPTDQVEREAAIAAAIRTLDREADFTQAGRPKVASLEKALGWKPSADEVEAIAGTAEKLAAILGAA